jgi:hypothetical protein
VEGLAKERPERAAAIDPERLPGRRELAGGQPCRA